MVSDGSWKSGVRDLGARVSEPRDHKHLDSKESGDLPPKLCIRLA